MNRIVRSDVRPLGGSLLVAAVCWALGAGGCDGSATGTGGASTGGGGSTGGASDGGSTGGTSDGGSTGGTSTGGGGSTGTSPAVCTPGETQSCYGGPPGTQGVGVCTGGTQTCNADGSAFGPCTGEVVPAEEVCYGGLDENCDGKIDDQGEDGSLCGAYGWSKVFGDGETQRARSVATDADGNVVVAGVFGGTIALGGAVLTSAGQNDIFVAKLDGAGNHLWSHRFGGAGDEGLGDMVVDAGGGVVLTGSFSGDVDFGDGTVTAAGGKDAFLARLGPDGSTAWSLRFGGASTQQGDALATDADGNILLLGSFYNDIDLGGGTMTTADNKMDVFLAKLDGYGGHLWSKQFGGPDWQIAEDVAVDPAGNVVLHGTFQTSINLGGDTFTVLPGGLLSTDSFLAKLDPSGAHLWSKALLDDDDSAALFRLQTDAAGNILLAGTVTGTIDLGAGQLPAAGGTDALVAKLDPDGQTLWNKRFGPDAPQELRGAAVDAAGNLIFTGKFGGTGPVDLGSGPLAGVAGGTTLLVGKLDPGGTLVWARAAASKYGINGNAAAVDPAGNVFIAGDTAGGVDLGSGELPFNGIADALLIKYSP